MSKISAPSILSRESMPDAPDDEWFSTLLDYNNSFNDQVAKNLRGGITLGDNTPYKTQRYNLTHGVETEISNPLDGLTIKGVWAMQCEGVTVDSTNKPTGAIYALGLGRPIEWRPSGKPGGSVFVKAEYDLRHTEPCLIKTTSATQTLNNGVDTLLSGYDTTLKTRGSIITDDGSTFTMSEAGTYLLTVKIAMPSGFLYTVFQLYATIGGVVALLNHFDSLAFTDQPIRTLTGIFNVTAGQTLTTRAVQTSGGNRVVPSGMGSRYIAITRQYNDSLPVGRVNLLFYGE